MPHHEKLGGIPNPEILLPLDEKSEFHDLIDGVDIFLTTKYLKLCCEIIQVQSTSIQVHCSK